VKVVVLLLLVACGSKRDEPSNQPETARSACGKPGTTVCEGDDVMICEGDDRRSKITSCRGGCKQGACVDTCGANLVELVYVIDDSSTLLSFDPTKLPADPFKPIGKLGCGATSRPNSMAVDRTGIAWVGYDDGVLYQASILDAHCFSQSSRPEGAPTTFGMGFVTDAPKATTEKLYVVEFLGNALATIDTSVFPTRWVPQGSLTGERLHNPELTGTSEGKLYGYFPGDRDRGFVQEIDRKGKLVGEQWKLPAGEASISAWAFAFWGDVFYVFISANGSNEVHALHRTTGKHELVVKSSAHRIVGAGVSTCAPLLEKPL
jgi:hypothetical protein